MKKTYALVVGGANVDIMGRPEGDLVLEESNPGQVRMSPGGVGRNMADNLARMGVRTELVTALGTDERADFLRQSGPENLSLDEALVFEGGTTSTYLVIVDGEGEVLAAISDMALMDMIKPYDLVPLEGLILGAGVLVLDTNLPPNALAHLVGLEGVFKIIDGVSAAKVGKLAPLLGKIDLLKVNDNEAEVLAGLKICDLESRLSAGQALVEAGVGQVVITAGAGGAYAFSSEGVWHFWSNPLEVENATGAGDAFTALLAYGKMKGLGLEEACIGGVAGSRLALKSRETISSQLGPETIEKEKEEVFYERLR